MNVVPPPVRRSSPVRMQRVVARGAIDVRAEGARTRLVNLFQEGSAKIRMPAEPGDHISAVLINTAGGMTGGDRVSWAAKAGAGAHLSLTTQACEKVYRTSDSVAAVDIRLEAGKEARLAWLPQETILFDQSALRRTMNIDLAPGASCLLTEAVILGRKAMGELVRQCRFRDSWRVRVDGRLVHAEEFRFNGDAAGLFARAAIGAGASAMATLLMVGPDAGDRLGVVRRMLADHPDFVAGVSAWKIGPNGKLLARLIAEDGYQLRHLLQPLIELLNGKAGLPRIWTV